MFGATPAAPDLQITHQEGDRNLLQLLLQQAVGEPTVEGHQMVGRYGPRDSDTHDPKLYGARAPSADTPRGRAAVKPGQPPHPVSGCVA
jgi:hypothetical protein